MDELTPLQQAQASVVGLAQAEHQLAIVARLRRAAGVAETQNRLTEASALRAFADALEAEVDIRKVHG